MERSPRGTPPRAPRINTSFAPPGGPQPQHPPGAPGAGAAYFRRTSLAIAAARRFTLHEQAAAYEDNANYGSRGGGILGGLWPSSGQSPSQSPPSPILISSPTATSPTATSSPRVARVQDGVARDHDPEAPPIGVTFGGISVGGTGTFGGRGGDARAAHYASPLEEDSDEAEDNGGGSGEEAASRAAAIAHAAAAHLHKDPFTQRRYSQPMSARSPPATPGGTLRPRPPVARRRSSAAPPRYRWLSGGHPGNTGDEPGVDVRSARDQETYGHLKARTHVTVVDYSSDPDAEDTNVRVDFPGARLAQWLNSSAGARPAENGRPLGVRWIHVAGLNWEGIKTLALKFQLHPLAVEDALRSGRSPRSKVDFYKTHLYLQILVQHIHAPDRLALARAAEGLEDDPVLREDEDDFVPDAPRHRWRWWRRSGGIRLPEGVESVFEPSVQGSMERSRKAVKKDVQLGASRIAIDQLSASFMVPIRKGVLSVFMMRDGTLISMCAHEIHEALEPIYQRLEDEHSLLRRSGDASMLAHALLDVTVDLAVEITQAFEEEILNAESKVLVQARLGLVRRLHIIQAQITRFRRQLSGLLHACYVIRDQDAQRSQAAGQLTLPRSARLVSDPTVLCDATIGLTPANSNGATPTHNPQAGIGGPLPSHHNGHLPSHWSPAAGGSQGHTPRQSGTPMPTPTPGPAVGAPSTPPQQGYFSPLAKVYMNDVIDHLEMVVSSAEQFVGTCDHLTDYVFNVLSFHTNNSMERLSIVTVVFLPLTFIASYFGMNFEDFPSLNNPDSYFWKVAAPCTVTFFIVFSYSYIVQAMSTAANKLQRYKREREIADVLEK